MTLKGIDVSSWNGWPFNAVTESAYKDSDFVIAKATEGTGYVNPFCDPAIQRAKKDGKLWGFYHYANGGDAKIEAEYFYRNCRGYFGHGIPVLDWEAGGNRAWGSDSWCRRFADHVHKLTGVWPMIYVQASAVGQCASCSKDCALWIAGYPDLRNSWSVPAFSYGTGAWKTYTIWQYTSGGGIDRNVAQLTREAWAKIASGGKSAAAPKPSAPARWPLQMWQSNGAKAQKFDIKDVGNGLVTIICKADGRAIDVNGGVAKPLTEVNLYTPNNTKAQKWKLVPVSGVKHGALYEIVSALDDGLCLDVRGGSSNPRTGLCIYTRKKFPHQQWGVMRNSDGTYSFAANLNGAKMFLDCKGGGK